MILSNTLDDLIHNMEQCEQFPGMNMIQHGEAVNRAFVDLIGRLEGDVGVLEFPP